MTYENIKRAVFLDRPNRFIANIELNGEIVRCHVKNTGRCKELLSDRAPIFVQEVDLAARKTQYDLISVYKGTRLINIDSQVPNKVFGEWVRQSGLFKNLERIKPEFTIKNSRFDFLIEADGRKALIEVKGVTLERDGVALFPDAPTERGVKHLRELAECKADGFDAYIVFIVQMKEVLYVTPNVATHPAFGEALRLAAEHGVKVLALDCEVTEDSITARKSVEVKF